MTEKDKELIDKAWKLNPIFWGQPWEWANDADTEEAKDMLRSISKHLYSIEESAM
jgi:hypothetical protein